MTVRSNIVLVLSFGIALVGCSSATSVQKADISRSGFDGAVFNGETTVLRDDIPDSDAYRIFHHGATGFTPVTAVRSSAEQRAQQFCSSKGKLYELLRETVSVGAHVLGNFPRAELVFTCLDRQADKELGSTDRYEELRKLKSLLDEGIITQSEYEREKNEILLR